MLSKTVEVDLSTLFDHLEPGTVVKFKPMTWLPGGEAIRLSKIQSEFSTLEPGDVEGQYALISKIMEPTVVSWNFQDDDGSAISIPAVGGVDAVLKLPLEIMFKLFELIAETDSEIPQGSEKPSSLASIPA